MRIPPNAGLEEPLDVWTAERFATKEALFLDAPIQLYNAAAALHEPSGRLAGFTRLRAPHVGAHRECQREPADVSGE